VPHHPLVFLLLTILVELSLFEPSAAYTPRCNSFKLLFASDHIPSGIDERGPALAYYGSEPYKERPGGQEYTSSGGWTKHPTIVVHGLGLRANRYGWVGAPASGGPMSKQDALIFNSASILPYQMSTIAICLVDPSLTWCRYRPFQTWTNARHMLRKPKPDPCGTCTKSPGSYHL
jgi:hypothetical protein